MKLWLESIIRTFPFSQVRTDVEMSDAMNLEQQMCHPYLFQTAKMELQDLS